MSAARVADWTHSVAVTVLMVLALNAAESWWLAVITIAAYFASIAAETWLYCEARHQRWTAADR